MNWSWTKLGIERHAEISLISKYIPPLHGPLWLPLKGMASCRFAAIKNVCVDVDIWTFSSDSIWFLCLCESALHQYYMPTLAEEGFFLLGNGNRKKHKHTGHKQQKFKLFPYVELEERLTGLSMWWFASSMCEDGTEENKRVEKWSWFKLDAKVTEHPHSSSWRGNVVGTRSSTARRTLHKTPAVMSLTPGYGNSRLQWPENN